MGRPQCTATLGPSTVWLPSLGTLQSVVGNYMVAHTQLRLLTATARQGWVLLWVLWGQVGLACGRHTSQTAFAHSPRDKKRGSTAFHWVPDGAWLLIMSPGLGSGVDRTPDWVSHGPKRSIGCFLLKKTDGTWWTPTKRGTRQRFWRFRSCESGHRLELAGNWGPGFVG